MSAQSLTLDKKTPKMTSGVATRNIFGETSSKETANRPEARYVAVMMSSRIS